MNKFIAVAGLGAALAGILGAGTASADTGGYSGTDATFYRLLTTGPYAMKVFNFPLLTEQGQEACQRMAEGASAQDALHALMGEGPYSFDAANTIVSAASVAYCLEDEKAGQLVDCQRDNATLPEGLPPFNCSGFFPGG